MSAAEGWAYLWNATKAHFFTVKGESLCGRWLFLGTPCEREVRPDDCAACQKKLAARAKPCVAGQKLTEGT